MSLKIKKSVLYILMALNANPALVFASTTDLANSPLTNTGATTVRPNIMMIFDNSGSMASNYTPDYVNDGNTCWGGADNGSTHAPIACNFGDNAYNSPDFNSQYYNPAIRYKPGKNANGTDKTSYDAANSTNWTVVPNDAYGKVYTGNTNLTNGVKDRIWCISYAATDDSKTTKTSCRVNEGSTSYPEILGSNGVGVDTFSYGKTASNGSIRYRYGAPYYYTINPTEYCSDADLKTCKPLTSPGTGADAAYIYPAKVRFCTDSTLTTCQARFKDTGTPTYKYPKFVGKYQAAVTGSAAANASGTLTINNISGNNTGAQITSLIVNGNEFGPINLNSNNTSTVATSIASILNASSGATGFNASAASNVITLTATATGTAWNNKAFSATSSTVIEQYPVYTFTFTGVSTSSTNKLNKSGTSVNSTNILNANVSVSAYGSNNSTNRLAFCNVVQSNLSSAFTVDTACALNGNNAVLKFKPTSTTLGANPTMSNWNANPSVSTSGITMTSTNSTAGVTGQVSFKANGGTAGTSVSGTTSGGADLIAGSNPARVGAGQFTKVFIEPTTTSYPKAASRDDCAGTTCTYAEEMTNYANWWAYYRSRNQSMKTAVGRAFSALGDNYRVGLVDLSQSWSGDLTTSATYVGVQPFTLNSTHRSNWYTKLYNIGTPNSTYLRSTLWGVGQYYAGNTTATDPIEYSCQQNYAFLATDGYWNGDSSWTLAGNQDNANSAYSKRSDGAFDGAISGASNTLADVAMYFYKNDLRTTGSVATNNVPTTAKDKNTGQHMVTFTMGLGVDGLMHYTSDYDTSGSGDFTKIVNGDTGCSWESSTANTCNWPLPAADRQSAVDDLWHAAVNGRGKYYSAKNPQDAADGLSDALAQIQQVTGAAAASATSSPNITPSDNSIYSSTYQTVVWDGEVVKQRIDPSTGTILAYDAAYDWTASTKINTQADALAGGDATARNLYTFDRTAVTTDKKKAFEYSALTAAEQALFSSKCSGAGGYSQCATMSTARKTEADNSLNLINYLRGYNTSNAFSEGGLPYGYLDIFRNNRTNRLGDTINATPTYVRLPQYTFNYTTPGQLYNDFKTAQASRTGVLYIAANDGFLHALNGSTGSELWAYTPRMIMSNLYKLADQSYVSNHQYFVDGSPVTMDVYDTSTNTWKTILVGGLNSGGQGYYGLDITDPSSPKALWETCSQLVNCKATHVIPDLGYTYGNPIITRLPTGNTNAGKWVVLVTSGYNNVTASGSTGVGKLFVIDALTGLLLDTYSTGAGNTTTPSGLSKLSTAAPNFYYDGYSTTAYAGDLLGNIWRFDLSKNGNDATSVKRVGITKDSGGNTQPITSRIEIGSVPSTTDHPVLYVGTGKYLGSSDLSDVQTQSLYAIKDQYFGNASASEYSDLRNASFVAHTISDVSGVRTVSTEPVNWASQNGWRVDLPDSGERINLDPQLVLGTLTVSANVVNPSVANACSVGGYGYLYQFDYSNGAYISTATAGAVAKKNANALLVGNVIVKLPSGVMKVITTSATGAKTVDALYTSSSSSSGTRISWRELNN